MSTTLSQLRKSAQEFIDVMKLTDTVDGKKVPVKLKDEMQAEDFLDIITSCIEMIEPDDKFSAETEALVDELTALAEGENISIEKEEKLKDMTLENYITEAETLKQLKEICQSEPQFKPIRGRLGSFKDVDTLKEEMFCLLSDKKTPMKVQELPLEETNKEVDERIHKENIEDAPIRTSVKQEKKYIEGDVEDMMAVENLVMIKPFKEIFETEAKVLQAVTESMAANGYDKAFPIIAWEDVVVDGHTRLKAAMANGILRVPVLHKKFKDEKEAVEYAVANQRNRRNLTEAEILRCIEIMDKPMSKKEAGKKGGKVKEAGTEKAGPTHKTTAKAVGVGETKVIDARTVLTDEKAKEAVLSGKKTIKAAAAQVREKKKKKEGKPFKEKVVKPTTKELLDEAIELIEHIYDLTIDKEETSEIADKCAIFLEKV